MFALIAIIHQGRKQMLIVVYFSSLVYLFAIDYNITSLYKMLRNTEFNGRRK